MINNELIIITNVVNKLIVLTFYEIDLANVGTAKIKTRT